MTEPEDQDLVAKQIGIKEILTTDLHPNPHNPRLLFDREPLDVLTNSIKSVGILVPLTVYKEAKKDRYVILDGQRRWTCASRIGMKKVPVNIVSEPSLIQNIVTMFQIHKLREDWELMPTALKLELLMQELRETNDKRIAALTGLDQAVVVRCKKLLSYSKKYQDLMLDPDPKKRVKADFFIELYAVRNDREVNKMEWYSKEKFTGSMLAKHLGGDTAFRSVTDFRIVKEHINNAVKAGKVSQISKRLQYFTTHENVPIDSLAIDSAGAKATVRKMIRGINSLRDGLLDLDIQSVVGEEEFWDGLIALDKIIIEKVTKSGRRMPR